MAYGTDRTDFFACSFWITLCCWYDSEDICISDTVPLSQMKLEERKQDQCPAYL